MFGQLARIERRLDALLDKNEQIQRPNRWIRIGRLELEASWLSTLSPSMATSGYLYRNPNKSPAMLTEIAFHAQVISNPFDASRPVIPEPEAHIRVRLTMRTRHNSLMDNMDYKLPVQYFPVQSTTGIYWGAAVTTERTDLFKPNLLIEPDDFLWAEIWSNEFGQAQATLPVLVAGLTATVQNYTEARY